MSECQSTLIVMDLPPANSRALLVYIRVPGDDLCERNIGLADDAEAGITVFDRVQLAVLVIRCPRRPGMGARCNGASGQEREAQQTKGPHTRGEKDLTECMVEGVSCEYNHKRMKNTKPGLEIEEVRTAGLGIEGCEMKAAERQDKTPASVGSRMFLFRGAVHV